MPRDLFVETVTHKYAPKRSKWTIAGSILAHAVLLGILVVVPILSALENYVVHANKLTFVIPPRAVMPVMPAAPPKTATPVTEVLKPAAPAFPPDNPVTTEVAPPVNAGPPIPFELPRIGNNVGILGGKDPAGKAITEYRPPAAAKREPIRPGGLIKTPARSYYVEPIYPALARTAGLGGYVILEAIVDESGAVRDLNVLKSNPMFDRAALEAVAKWRYTPTLLNGVAVPIVMTVTVTFALR